METKALFRKRKTALKELNSQEAILTKTKKVINRLKSELKALDNALVHSRLE